MHTCCDIHFFTCMPPLSRTVHPITPTSGKGSRPKDWPRCACGNHAKVGGEQPAKQGLFKIWYAIDGLASCGTCWMNIYYQQDAGGDD